MDNVTVQTQYPTCPRCGFRGWDDANLARHIKETHPSTGTTTTLNVECRSCHDTSIIRVHFEDYQRWQGGTLIQNAMPYLSADDRELLISGTCGKCFDALFSPEFANYKED